MTGLDVCGRDFVMRRAMLFMFPTACSASMCWRSNGCTPESFATSPSLVFRKGCLVKLFRRQDSLSVVIRRDGCVFPSYLLPRCFVLINKQCRGWICTACTALVYAAELGSTINAGNLECEPVFRNQRSDLKARSKVRHSHTS